MTNSHRSAGDPSEASKQPSTPRGEPVRDDWETWTPPSVDERRIEDSGDDSAADNEWPSEQHYRPGSFPGRRRRQTRHFIREFIETSLMAVLVFLAIRATFQNYRVQGHSMDPTLQNGEYLLVNRIEYSEINVEKLSRVIPFLDPGDDDMRDVFHAPQRGHVVILVDPRHPDGDRLVKRVIGLPGETIEILNGRVYINGRQLHEPYVKTPWQGSTPLTRIRPDEYFVMGDNRGSSEDSRFFGMVPRDLIIGKAMAAFWPLDKAGLASNESPTLDSAATR